MAKELAPLLRARFTPGASYTDESIAQFYTFLPRKSEESTVAYAGRLHSAGFAQVCTSEDMRDLTNFRQISADAKDLGCPVLILTGTLPDMSEPITGPKMLSEILNRDGTPVAKPALDTSRITDLTAPEIVKAPAWNQVERRAPITSE